MIRFNRQLVLFSMILLLAIQAGAASQGMVSLRFSTPTLVAGKSIDPGEYLVRWRSTSSQATVAFVLLGEVVAQVNARIEDRQQASARDAIVAIKSESGQLTLKEIRIRGKKQVLVFE
jgi:ABC-type thiamine transport system substrate-binding protein